MSYLPAFIEEHQLTPDADERSLKRAYAKKLKTIDQETQLHEFQALRESYEEALHWIAWRDTAQEREDETTGEPATDQEQLTAAQPAPMSGHSQVAVQDVTDETEAAASEASPPQARDPAQEAADILQSLLNHIHQEQPEQDQVTTILENILDSDTMLFLETRQAFEWYIASYLVQGWQSGKDLLFHAAVTAFRWREAKTRLSYLGPHAYALEQAMIELDEISKRPEAIRHKYQEIMRKSRNQEQPGLNYLKVNLQLLARLNEAYPHVTAMSCDMALIRQWIDSAYEEKEKSLHDVREQNRGEKKNHFSFSTALLVMLFVFIFRMLSAPPDEAARPSNTSTPQSALSKVSPLKDTKTELFYLGEDYLFGRDGKPIDTAMTIRNWEASARMGSVDAQYALAKFYKDGLKIPVDKTKSHYWMLQAAENKKIAAMVTVGENFQFGEGTNTNLQAAYDWYEKAANAGDRDGQFRLAILIASNMLVKKDNQRITELLELSAQQGNANAGSYLGLGFQEGWWNLKRDNDKANYWFLRYQHHPLSQEQLGLAYEHGRLGHTKDLALALNWYQQALKNGNQKVARRIETICKKNPLQECKT
ncbi:tetratricopeptide repeat protein [Undibacterium curvum]|uniref:Sel1 repeat family protein n=1 Tax=Undibacterium curvum TaxID=2762294 RepID=A0ABR7A6N5_9BURK|nr:tetratricopeptide repeat protein [Undibacterium curvum]MBC3932322.1 sel1 repeat family protein [Undibacterium curvum]